MSSLDIRKKKLTPTCCEKRKKFIFFYPQKNDTQYEIPKSHLPTNFIFNIEAKQHKKRKFVEMTDNSIYSLSPCSCLVLRIQKKLKIKSSLNTQ